MCMCIGVHKMQLHCRGFLIERGREREREKEKQIKSKSERRSLPRGKTFTVDNQIDKKIKVRSIHDKTSKPIDNCKTKRTRSVYTNGSQQRAQWWIRGRLLRKLRMQETLKIATEANVKLFSKSIVSIFFGTQR